MALNKFFSKLRTIFSHEIEKRKIRSHVRSGTPVPFQYQGNKFFVNPDSTAEYHVFNSTQKLSRMVELINKDAKIIFDVGANCGIFSALVALKLSESKVYAFEPSPELTPFLEMNCRQLGIEILTKAIGEENGRKKLFVNLDSQQANSFVLDAAAVLTEQNRLREIEVDCITLDSFARSRSIGKVDVLKIDVQGFEGCVLRGAKDLVKSVDQLFIESTWLDVESVIELIPFAISCGFKFAVVINPVYLGADILLSRTNPIFADKQFGFALTANLLKQTWV